MFFQVNGPRFWMVPLVVSLLILAGCRSIPKVDWVSRVGTYNYDQAILELGPPDRVADLTDGTRIAEWYQRRRTGLSFGLGTGFSTGGVGVGVGQSISPPPGTLLRLTFRNGVLSDWSRSAR